MGTYQPQGSEKIQDPKEKWERIKEMSGIGNKQALTENKLNTKFSTVLHEAVAADGKTYGLIQEGPKVYIKHLINDHYEYLTGDEKDYAYKDFAQAFKHMNLLFKDISQQAGFNDSINLFEGGLKKKDKSLTESGASNDTGETPEALNERYVLKQPAPQAPPAQPAPTPEVAPAPSDSNFPPDQMPVQNPQAAQELGQEVDAAEGQMEDPAKVMQKLVGKLTQKMRAADDQTMTSEFMKSILNSVISAVRKDKMEDADLLSVIRNLKGEENAEAASPEGGENDFVDSQGIDYNVNNSVTKETQPTELKEEDFVSTTDDQTQKDAFLLALQSAVGMEINPSNENDVHNAVQYFIDSVSTSENGQNPIVLQAKHYLETTPSAANERPTQVTFQDLTPTAKEIVTQLEMMLENTNQEDDMSGEMGQQPQLADSSQSTMGIQTESKGKDFLHKIIMEALNGK